MKIITRIQKLWNGIKKKFLINFRYKFLESLSETNQQPVCNQKQETSNKYRVTSDQQPVLFYVENMVLRGIRNFSVYNVNTIT